MDFFRVALIKELEFLDRQCNGACTVFRRNRPLFEICKYPDTEHTQMVRTDQKSRLELCIISDDFYGQIYIMIYKTIPLVNSMQNLSLNYFPIMYVKNNDMIHKIHFLRQKCDYDIMSE